MREPGFFSFFEPSPSNPCSSSPSNSRTYFLACLHPFCTGRPHSRALSPSRAAHAAPARTPRLYLRNNDCWWVGCGVTRSCGRAIRDTGERERGGSASRHKGGGWAGFTHMFRQTDLASLAWACGSRAACCCLLAAACCCAAACHPDRPSSIRAESGFLVSLSPPAILSSLKFRA